ncbi:MAG: IPT/TIG domain-containing protein [Thermoanaerobaculia bacterium]
MFDRRVTLPVVVSVLMAAGTALGTNQPPKAGFTKKIANVGWARQSRPVLANLGFGGKKSIVFGTSGTLPAGSPGGVPTAGGWLVVVNADGTIPSGFPVQLPAEVNTPAVGDLNGDGVGDVIVVGYGGNYGGSAFPGGIRAYNTNGTLRWDRLGLDFNSDGVPDPVYATPAIADVDGDGTPEVSWGGFDGWVYLADLSTGANESGWPLFMKDTIYSSPALHDLNGDGKREIIIGVDAHAGDVVLGAATPDGGCLWALTSTGARVPGFPYCTSMVIWSAPAVGDIDGDGKPEIVFGTGDCTVANGCVASGNYVYTHKVYAIETNGTNTPGWPVSVDGEVGSRSGNGAAPALGDLDGDSLPDVVAVDSPPTAGGVSKVYAWKGNGTQLFKTVLTDVSGNSVGLGGGDPVIGDVTGDSKPEVLVPLQWEPVVVSSAGAVLTSLGGLDYSTWGPVGAVAVGDLESDGVAIEIVVASSSYAQTGSLNESEVWAWSPKAATTPSWGMFHQGERRLGVLPGTPAGPAPTPPTIVSASPSTGTTEGGTQVTISGTGFQTGATVTFGGTSATNVNVSSTTTLTATTPARAAGTVTIAVSNPDGGSGSLTDGYTYVAPPLSVTGITPRTGVTSGGTLVTVSGTGFVSGATVTFRGAPATGVVFQNSTSIRANTPARPAGPADVVVSNPGGASATLPGGYLYSATGLPPRFYSMTPCRVIDTRNSAGPFGGPSLAPLAVRSFDLAAGGCGIPGDAAGISLNVTIADASSSGNLTIYPGLGTVPGTNTITFRPGKNRANNVQIGLVGGVLSVYDSQTSGGVHLIVDVNGYFR